MATRSCPQCGAIVEMDPTHISATCAFCDANLVDHTATLERPDRIAPFEVDGRRAVRALKSFLADQWLAPEGVRQAADPSELRAVFVPFYAYDAVARTRYECTVGVDWQKTETYTVEENGRTVTKTRTVTETEWFPLQGTHGRTWLDHLVSASRGLPEDESNRLEPYDLGRTHPYDPAHHAGMDAEHPTVPRHEAESTATTELEALEKRTIEREFLPGDHVRMLHTTSEFDIKKVALLLLPVWVAVVDTEDGQIRLLVNGQTAAVVGDVPRSTTKVLMLIAAALVAFLVIIVGWLVCNGGHGLLI